MSVVILMQELFFLEKCKVWVAQLQHRSVQTDVCFMCTSPSYTVQQVLLLRSG